MVVPGFADFNTRVREPDGFQLPNVARDRTFASIGGHAKFTIATPPDLTLPPGRLRMMTIRSHDQYNTTIYGLDDRYRGHPQRAPRGAAAPGRYHRARARRSRTLPRGNARVLPEANVRRAPR